MQELILNVDNRKTEIVIGHELFSLLGNYRFRKKLFLVDENVLRLHGYLFETVDFIAVPEGELQKTLSFAEDVFRKMVELELDRGSLLIGVGGGLVSDLTGFVGSTYMRGIDFGFISSTLLGQVDASIGGKNGVNLDGYKNMIGVINQPLFVYSDLSLLDTLPKKELVSGFAEVIKYGAIKSPLLFKFLEENFLHILKLDRQSLLRIVNESAAIKIDIVQNDVNEKGDRKLLNFGHTLGHAIEKLSGMQHGEAVAIGMVMAAKLSVQLGFLNRVDANKLIRLIEASGLPTKCPFSANELFDVLLKDKKRSGDKIHFILLRSIGDAFVHTLKLKDLKTALDDLY